MPRYRLLVEYDGTKYSGWQVQREARTVQGTLITAATQAFGGVGEVMGSGRTDAGVHALGQVLHIDLGAALDPVKIGYGLNDNLPADINVRQVWQAAPDFHARHHAVSRSYIYQISSLRTAFAKNFVWWVRDTLDLGAMRRAALAVPGMHDFSAFAEATKNDEGSAKVLVDSLEIAEHGQLLLIRIRASHFLHKMVRRLVGTLVETGRGTLKPTVIAEALDGKKTDLTRYTAPPSGLFLEGVTYRGESFPKRLTPALQMMHWNNE